MDRPRHGLASLAAAALVLPATGCLFGPGLVDPIDDLTQDLEQFCDTADALQEGSTEVLGESAGELFSTGETLFWLDFSAYDPTLHSEGDTVTHYGFPVSHDGLWNVRASDELVVTAVDEFGSIRYLAYATGAPEALLGEAVFDAPGDEQRWWAYAVDGGTVYVVTTGAQTTLWSWVPGGEPTALTTLESAGASVGEFWELGVDGDRVVFVESGRVWVLELGSNTATWSGNPTQASGTVHIGDDGVLFDTAAGPQFYRFADGTLEDVGAAIEASAYRFNETYTSLHLYQGGLTRVCSAMVYEGSHGIYAYDLQTRAFAPLLLSPCDEELRIDYRDPVYRDPGTLYVTALQSESGAVGADGPVVRVDLAGRLP